MAPELYIVDKTTSKIKPYKGNPVDVFASGITLLASLVKVLPFKNT